MKHYFKKMQISAIVGLCRNTEESVTILCLSFFQWKNEGRL